MKRLKMLPKKITAKMILAGSLAVLLSFSACATAGPVEVAVPDPPPAAPAAPEAPGTADAGNEDGEIVTLTFFTHNLGDSVIQSFNDNYAYQRAMEILGIHVDFQHAAAGQAAEQIGVMIASRDLPDILEVNMGGYVYPRGWAGLVEDGFALRLNDIVDEHMPDFIALLRSNEELARQTILDDGTIWAVPALQPDGEKSWRGVAIRGDLLDQGGIPLPQTISELRDALLYLQSEHGMTHPVPFNPNAGSIYSDGAIVSAWDIGGRWFIRDGEYHFGPMQDEYLEFLREMNHWFNLGLIDPDSPAMSGADIEAAIVTGQMGITMGMFGGFGPHFRAQTSGAELNPDFRLEPLPNLPLVAGDQVRLKNFNFYHKGHDTIISATSLHPYEAAAFLNFGFTEYGRYLFNYGVEGISWERGPGGEIVWTDRILNSPDGSWVNIRERYKRHVGPYHRFDLAAPMTDFELHLITTWDQPSDYLAPVALAFTADEQTRFTAIWADVNTLLMESLWRFISGAESLDNFDQFRAQLEAFGIEEARTIQNAALERYMARVLN